MRGVENFVLKLATDQYCVNTDSRDTVIYPYRANNPQYILQLIKKAFSISLETVRTVVGLPGVGIMQEILSLELGR